MTEHKCKKIVLVALNSSYSHTNLGLRYLRQHLHKRFADQVTVHLLETTINEPEIHVLEQLLEFAADLYAFSCYIWNSPMVRALAGQLKAILPTSTVVWGGPDASSQADQLLAAYPWIDCLIHDEGESAWLDWLEKWLSDETNDALPRAIGPTEEKWWSFPYTDQELAQLKQKILYYEGSRGCDFKCTYCLSCLTSRARYLPLEQVLSELDHILSFNPRQVKLIDRTFNSDASRAEAIWRHLIERAEEWQTRTNFHFEISAELLTESQLKLLARAPRGLFQFEIGAQTTNPEILRVIRRPSSPRRFQHAVETLRRQARIHLHLDLIAGLPGESLASQIQSANELLNLRPHMLQLGFLKVLPQTPIWREAKQRGMIWQEQPPYEVLQSDGMKASELMYLRRCEEIVGDYYNSGAFFFSLSFLLSLTKRKFDLLIELQQFLQLYFSGGKPSQRARAEAFQRFGDDLIGRLCSDEQTAGSGRVSRWQAELEEHEAVKGWLREPELFKRVFRDLLKIDYFLQGHRDFPLWLDCLQQTDDPQLKDYLNRAQQAYRDSGIRGRARFEDFCFDPRELPGFRMNEQLYDGVGPVLPDPLAVFSWLSDRILKPASESCAAGTSRYIAALHLGDGRPSCSFVQRFVLK